MSTRIKVEMEPVSTILTRLGVDRNGDVQMQLTRIVNKRITRYMPFRSGALATKLKYIKSPTEIEVLAPYARYHYYGKLWVDHITGSSWSPKYGWKVPTKKNLKYDTAKHPEAGPYWDRRMMAAEKDAIASDVQAYVRRRGK